MALREKLGRLVLLDETDASGLGREYRAARLGPAGLDRLVTVLCFTPEVSSQATATKRLMDEARMAARLQNPGLVRVLGIGRVEQTFYISTELIEGHTLAAIFERCRQEAFPFAADHALMVASRVASGLEYLHGKKDESGAKLCHGLVGPSRIVISYDGEVKIKGLGLWPALRETDLLGSERAYLAPEQAAGGAGDARSDMYALGLVLLQALTGRAPDGSDPRAALADAKVVNVSGDSSPVPKTLLEMLERALAEDPAARYPTMAEMRKAIDTLLFSGDFTPTTFDLAFFMHTLFRDDMERESRAIEEARKANYQEFLEEKPGAAAAESAPKPTTPPAAPEAPPPVARLPVGTEALPLVPPPVPQSLDSSPRLPKPAAADSPAPSPSHGPTPTPHAPVARAHEPLHGHETRVSESGGHVAAKSSRDASLHLTVGGAEAEAPKRSPLMLVVAGVVAVAAIGTGLWMWLGRHPATPTAGQSAPLTPEAAAALARVKELESRLADLEKQRVEAETRAAEEARKKIEAAAAAKGRAADAAAIARAQEEARQRARAEQEQRTRMELKRLTEAKKADEARLAQEMKAAEVAATAPPPAPTNTPAATTTATPPAATTATTTATTTAAAPPTAAAPASTPQATPSATAAPTQPGSLVALNDPKLIPPFQLSGNLPVYPPLAQRHGIEGSVALSALVDETGRVAQVTVKSAKPQNVGFEQAATDAVRSRRYRPGTKDGVPVRVWVAIVLNFRR